MGIAQELHNRLEVLNPSTLDIRDDSESHRGHAGWREGGETHFHITLRAPALADLSRIARHRLVHETLGPDLVGRIHALSLDLGG